MAWPDLTHSVSIKGPFRLKVFHCRSFLAELWWGCVIPECGIVSTELEVTPPHGDNTAEFIKNLSRIYHVWNGGSQTVCSNIKAQFRYVLVGVGLFGKNKINDCSCLLSLPEIKSSGGVFPFLPQQIPCTELWWRIPSRVVLSFFLLWQPLGMCLTSHQGEAQGNKNVSVA